MHDRCFTPTRYFDPYPRKGCLAYKIRKNYKNRFIDCKKQKLERLYFRLRKIPNPLPVWKKEEPH